MAFDILEHARHESFCCQICSSAFPHAGLYLKNSLLAKILIETVTTFHESPGMNFISNLLQHLECRATKLHVYNIADEVHGGRTP